MLASKAQFLLPLDGLALRQRKCLECGSDFTYEIGQGKDRRLCSEFCRTRRRHRHTQSQALCVVEGCLNHRQYSAGFCNSCYYRLRRTGTLEKRIWRYRSLHSNGYIVVQDRAHPLANAKHGGLYEHRQVLFDAIGEGQHPCYWCGAPVIWVKGKCVKGSLVPDHLDGDKTNNAIGNLVPACNRCNATRGLFMSWVREHRTDPFLWQMYVNARETPEVGGALQGLAR